MATVLLASERDRLEAAGHGCWRAWHGDSIDDAARAVRTGAADALFISVHRCSESDLPRVARFVREFPHVPAVALISRPDPGVAGRVLRLGASGVHAVVDVSAPAGWQRLRDLLREPAEPVVALVMAELAADLDEAPPDCRLFFELVVRRAPELTTVLELARELRVVPTSLISRFLRAGLPSPKVYLAHTRLLHAVWHFSGTGLAVADVAHRLGYSSSQSFGRHIRGLLGMTAGEYRRRAAFGTALSGFRAAFVTPFRDRLLTFHPLGANARRPRTSRVGAGPVG